MLFDTLFGSEEGVKKIVDGVYNGIDKSFFTEEEKAQYFLKLLEAYHPFKLAQRLIALLFVIPYVFVVLVFLGLFSVGLFLHDNVMIDVSLDLLDYVNKYFGVPVSIIVGFYFAGGAINSLKGVKS